MYVFRPEAEGADRAALLAALRELDAREPPAYYSPWRRAALDPDEEEDYAVAPAPPRSRRGATRA